MEMTIFNDENVFSYIIELFYNRSINYDLKFNFNIYFYFVGIFTFEVLDLNGGWPLKKSESSIEKLNILTFMKKVNSTFS